MNRQLIEQLVTKHEGRRSHVYTDTVGKPTIGIGWNLDNPDSVEICDHYGLSLGELKAGTVSLTDAQIDEVFSYQLTEAIGVTQKLFPNFDTMPDNVQAVICDMVFNMGEPAFSQFHATIAALNDGDWKLAAQHALQSLWAKQVPHRAADDAQLLQEV